MQLNEHRSVNGENHVYSNSNRFRNASRHSVNVENCSAAVSSLFWTHCMLCPRDSWCHECRDGLVARHWRCCRYAQSQWIGPSPSRPVMQVEHLAMTALSNELWSSGEWCSNIGDSAIGLISLRGNRFAVGSFLTGPASLPDQAQPDI